MSLLGAKLLPSRCHSCRGKGGKGRESLQFQVVEDNFLVFRSSSGGLGSEALDVVKDHPVVLIEHREGWLCPVQGTSYLSVVQVGHCDS